MPATVIGRAEAAVLCACARRRAQLSGIGSFDLAGARIDWDALLRAAEAHGVTELLAEPIASGPFDAPPAIRTYLERRIIEATAVSLNRIAELTGLLHLFADRGLPALAFKGQALAAGVYGHLGRRLSGDIDLFVERHDLQQIRRLLVAQGYRPRPRDRGRSESLLAGVFPSAGRVDEFLPGTIRQAAVDVHAAFAMWPFGIRCEARELFDRSILVDVAGHPIPTLCPADLLLVLAIHGAMHQWWPLRLVSDIDGVVDLIDDWDEVVARADAAGMRRLLWVALLLAERLFGSAVPSPVSARASADSGAMRIARWASARMFVVEAPSTLWLRRPWLRCFVPDTPRQQLGFYARECAYLLLKGRWNTRPGLETLTRAGV